MDKSEIVIIGGVACGCKTAASLARRMPQAMITLFQKEKELSYGTCGLPYFASGDIDSFRELTLTSYDVVRDSGFFKKSKNFDAVTESQVMAINREEKFVLVKDLKSGREYKHGYGKLVIATGANHKTLPLDIPVSDRIKPFTRPEHAINFRRMAQTGKIGSALILGGGFIGCEVAEAAAGLWGIETSLVEMEGQILPYVLDREMALPAEKEMENNGVKLYLGRSATKIEMPNEETVRVTLSDGTSLEVDYLFLCVGVKPATDLAREAGLEIGSTRGIKANQFMQTSDPDIYAGGDAVESTHCLTGKPIYIPMGSLANRHGRIIAEHISGGKESFPGVLGAFMIKVFEMNVGSVGLSEAEAIKNGIDVVSVWGSFVDKPDYYPENKSISIKMIIDAKDRRLVGLQGVGKGDIVRRVDVFSAFLQSKSRLDDLLNFEHGYAPPYSEALDPLYHLAAVAKSVELGFGQENPGGSFDSGDFILLDVREEEEIESIPFKTKNSVRIPLNDLRENLDKLDKGKKIVILCHRGPRSYQAAVILKNAGFENSSYIAGGTTLAVKSLA
jgi:NADPH-dependent 2,4-dienoyl-CoA reductase/sulfur reductase-like enzyme/rhodanese-related sulfurtransferase